VATATGADAPTVTAWFGRRPAPAAEQAARLSELIGAELAPGVFT
jgi:hypothetical protein